MALLTQPTQEENFAANLELRYIARGTDRTAKTDSEDIDEFGLFFEMLAIIP